METLQTKALDVKLFKVFYLNSTFRSNASPLPLYERQYIH